MSKGIAVALAMVALTVPATAAVASGWVKVGSDPCGVEAARLKLEQQREQRLQRDQQLRAEELRLKRQAQSPF